MIMAVSAVFVFISALNTLCLGHINRPLTLSMCIKRSIKTHRAFALSRNLNNTAYFPSPEFYAILLIMKLLACFHSESLEM